MTPAFILAILAQAAPQPVTVVIKNPSFEDAIQVQYQKPCGAFTYEVPQWTISGTAAALVPASPRACDFSNPPDGKQFVIIQNGSISQDLGDISAILPHDANGEVNGVYTLHFFVANYFYWYPGKYSVSLSLRGPDQVLCKTSGWGMGDFQDAALVCPSQRKYGHLILTLSSGSATGEPYGNGYENLFDKISLSFTPTN